MEERGRSDGWLYLAIAVVLIAALAVLTTAVLRMPARLDELARLGMDRTIQSIRRQALSGFDQLAEDLREEAAFVAVSDSTSAGRLLERWQALMSTKPALMAVHLADERGSEVSLLRENGTLMVRRSLTGPGLGYPMTWPLLADKGSDTTRRMIMEETYDPRTQNWFSRALEDQQGAPIWSAGMVTRADTMALLHVGQLIRPSERNRPFRVLAFSIRPQDVVRGTVRQDLARTYRAIVLMESGLDLLDQGPDSSALGQAYPEALRRWKVKMDRRAIPVEQGSMRAVVQILPHSMNGVNFQIGAVMDTEAIRSWTVPEWNLILWLGALLSILLILIIWAWLRRRGDQKRLRVQEKRSRSQERKLAKVLGERDVLDREVHHRVKNNLQVVSSLLNLQAQRLPDGAAREEFVRGKRRIDMMALVHHKLYGMPDLRGIRLDRLFHELAMSIAALFEPRSRTVSHSIEATGMVTDPDTAIDIGIIFCELLANCYQHAFPLVTGGHIEVEVRAAGDGSHLLLVKDNGTGMNPSSTEGQGKLGLEVVEALAEKLDGSATYRHEGGTICEVRFLMRAPAVESP
ncbi:MAG: sensor histidine kinase [Flavobacteriales bacterium]|jgi:two-component sensor histidine kinase|nr:sensor histidine kinase [Flavobacteriales bacterium]MBK7752959.1 sensor histidine kinase [Flavobacteriales bacterium]MBK9076280.1 sensor histidine kinase [Flavobacteriales bacterium]MBK9540434.1 sensor histidine kinase [Flavobacteriales bacterium]